jgi:GNAT superfamily N-acetyltransferase
LRADSPECRYQARLSHKSRALEQTPTAAPRAGAGTAATASLYSVVAGTPVPVRVDDPTTKSQLAGFVRQPQAEGAVAPHRLAPRMKARRLRRDEAGPLRELRLRALTDAPRELGCFLDEEAAFPSSYWRAIAEDTQVADRRVSVVADDGDQLVGMVGGDWDEQSGRVHLVALWVEPSSRGRGVGKALVAEVLSWARERQAHRVELWVVDDALAAAALYASCGFVETGVHQAVPYSPKQTERLLVRLM